jgi:hypothetical protein
MFELLFQEEKEQIQYSEEVHSSYTEFDSLLVDPELVCQWEKFLSGEDSKYNETEWVSFFFYLSQFTKPLPSLTLTFIDYEYGDFSVEFKEEDARIKLFLNAINPFYPCHRSKEKPRKKFPDTKVGFRQYSAVFNPRQQQFPQIGTYRYKPFILLDSGAFTETSKEKRVSLEEALLRMLQWEKAASVAWGYSVQANYFASYDCLPIGKYASNSDEFSLEAAIYLDNQRRWLGDRQLVLTAQGKTVEKQLNNAKDIINLLRKNDVLGIGGYANIGKMRSRLADFKKLMTGLKPLIVEHNVKNLHIWGVRWIKAIKFVADLFADTSLNITCDTSSHYQLWFRAKDESSLKKGGARSLSFPEHCALIQMELACL